MLITIVRKEVLEQLPSVGYLSGSVLMILLSALAALVGTLNFEQRSLAYREQVEHYDLALREVRRVYSFLQPVVVRQPEPLSIFVRGVEGRFDNEVTVHVFEVPGPTLAESRQNPFMRRLHDLDLTEIVRDVLGLLALLLTSNVLVGERERGNLALVLAHGARRSTLLVGKFLGAFLVLAAPLSLSVLASSAILFYHEGTSWEPRHAWRFAALVGGYFAYLAMMLVVGLALSVRARTAAQALTFSLLAWAVVVVIYPQAVTAVFKELAVRDGAPPTVDKVVRSLETELDARLQRIWEEEPVLSHQTGHRSTYSISRENRGMLRRFGSAPYYDALARYYRQEIELGREYADRIFEIRLQDAAERRRVERRGEVLASLSPAFLLGELAESLAGTSIEDQEAFLESCRVYRLKFLDYLTRQGAIGSWRWFTDDPSGEWPWPSFLGLAPNDVDDSNFDELFRRYVQPDVRTRRNEVEHQLDNAEDPVWSQALSALPRFRFDAVSLPGVLRREAPELVTFHLLWIAVAWGLWRRFAVYEPE